MRQVRPQHTDATHNQIDRNAGLRCCIQSTDNFNISKAIYLDNDSAGPSRFGVGSFAFDELDNALPQIHWRNQQAMIVIEMRKAGERIEEIGGVGGDLLISGEYAEIRIDSRSGRVVVARCQVNVALQDFAFAADDEREFTMGLQPDHSG